MQIICFREIEFLIEMGQNIAIELSKNDKDEIYRILDKFKPIIINPGDIDEHPMTEIDGGVFLVKGKKQPNDEDVKRLSPTHVLIIDKEGRITKIPLPYPFPYLNRIFCVTVPR